MLYAWCFDFLRDFWHLQYWQYFCQQRAISNLYFFFYNHSFAIASLGLSHVYNFKVSLCLNIFRNMILVYVKAKSLRQKLRVFYSYEYYIFSGWKQCKDVVIVFLFSTPVGDWSFIVTNMQSVPYLFSGFFILTFLCPCFLFHCHFLHVLIIHASKLVCVHAHVCTSTHELYLFSVASCVG